MIIRFENIDNPSYSAEFVFNSAGFLRAQYDLNNFISVTGANDPLLHPIAYNLISNDFVFKFHNRGDIYHVGYDVWSSFEIIGSSDTFIKRYNYDNYIPDSSSGCLCRAHKGLYNDVVSSDSYCYDYTVSNRINDSFTSSYYQFYELSYVEISSSGTTHIDKSDFDVYSINDCRFDYFPSIGFVENNISYPKFKIFAYGFNDFESSDCKYSLYLHFIDETISDIFKTLKVGSFGVYQGNFYFENFYGNKVGVSLLNKRYFDFYDFFNTNTVDNLSDYLSDNFSDFSSIDINSFGMPFVFELKKEDYSGVYMSTLDCECLNDIKFALNDIALNTSHLNDIAISLDTISNTLDGSLYGCENVGLATLFSRAFNNDNCLGSVFRNSCDKSIGVMFGDAFNDDCSGNYLGSVFKSQMLLEDELGLASVVSYIFSEPTAGNRRTIFVDEDGKSVFKNSCNLGIADSFTEAFNLSDECKGSVFKVNDNIWNDEDTLSGILYKVIDNDYVVSNDIVSPFYTRYSAGNGLIRHWPLPDLLLNSLFRTGSLGPSLAGQFSVFNVFGSGTNSFTDCLNRSFFSDNNNNSIPSKANSVFSFGYGYDSNKILNHACNVNPNSIKFCENVPFDFSGLPTPEVTVNNNVPVPSVDVDNNITVTPSTLDFSWDGFINSFATPFFRLFQSDNDSFLNVLKNALFCQFNNSGVKRYSWENSVFKKLLYSEDAEDCSEKVGLPELDLFVAPDNIYINSDGKPTRYTVDEVFK